MDNGFNITSGGISIGGWYSNFAEARAAMQAFVDCGCSGLRIESCDAGEQEESFYSAPEPQEMTTRWVRRMARAA